MPPLEDYDDLDHIHASRTPAGKALLSLSSFLDLHDSTLPQIKAYSATHSKNVSASHTLSTSAHAWLLGTKKSLSLHNGIVGLNGDIREVHAALEKDERKERGRLMEECKYAGSICNYHSVVEPKERSRLTTEEVALRQDIDVAMRRARSHEVPLRVSSNLMLQVLDIERVELHREFTETLETILLAEGLDREDLVASMVRRGKDPFRSPTVQGRSGNGQQQPPPYSSHHSQSSHTTTASHHQPQSSLLPSQFYQPSSAAAPHFVSGGSGRYNPNSPQPSRHNASHTAGTPHSSHHHHSHHHPSGPYQQAPVLGVPLGRTARPPSSTHHHHPQQSGSQRPPHHNPQFQEHHPSRHNTTQPNGTTTTQASYASGGYV